MTPSEFSKRILDTARRTACCGRRISCLLTGAAVILGLVPAPGVAQCPVPPSSPPLVDGAIDPVYFERGVTTDYVTATNGATASLHQIDDVCVDSQFIYLLWEIDLGFVDNSYGLNRNQGSNFPWPKGHSFADLTESDKQRLQILNVCGEDVVDISMDYIDGPNVPGPEYDTPSGYEPAQPADCAGALCGETAKILINGGDWTNFIYDTSLAHNLNDLGFCTNDGIGGSAADCSAAGTDLLVESPPWADEDTYVPQSPYDEWEYRHLYEMRIDRSVFSTASCPQGTPALIRTDPVELHASPSKTGQSPVDLVRAYSTIGDYVWLDADRDGVQDAGESGLANVTLDLYQDGDGDGILEPDSPVIDGRLDMNRDGFVDSRDDGSIKGVVVIDGLLDLDGDGIAGETNGDDSGTVDGIGVIDGQLDLNGDLAVDGADDGILANDDGGVVASTVTDSQGRYTFTRLGAGDYFVDVADDNGVLSAFSLINGPESDTDPSGLIALPLQEEYLLADFGYAPSDLTTAVVGDYVWSDADADGLQDPGEAGIAGVTVDLVDLDTLTVVASTVTAADGSYLFPGVAPGDYYVDVTDTAGVLSGYTLTSGPQSESDPSTAFHVNAGDVYLNADFGYTNPGLGSIGNLVWFDADEDGVFDVGEPGIGNVTVALIVDSDGNGVWDAGEPIVATAPTAADGSYSFSGLRLDDGGGDGDADYLVWVSDSNNVLGAYLDSIFLPLGSTSDNVSKIPAYAVDISPGSTVDTTADFGYLIDNPEALIGDRVWYDDDADGIQDTGEPGIEGVTLLLYDDKNKNGIIDGSGGQADELLGTRTTDINGTYYFQRLKFDSNAEGYIIVVSEFNFYDIIDGELDLNGDGVVDTSDDGAVDGVTVIDGRLDLDGDGAIETNGDDLGSFNGLNVVHGLLDLDRDGSGGETNGDDSRFPPLRDFVQTADPDEAGTCAACDGQGGSVVDTANTIDLTVDFGYDGTGTLQIGDTVYHDLNGNGVQDVGEPGLELVSLALYQDLDGDGVIDVDEPVIANDVTDAVGNYLFSDLVAGDYIVAITDSNGILVGYAQTEGSPTEPVSAADLSTLEKDFGFVRNLPATLSNFVWEDLDGDGIQDAGEPGIRNVVVNLYSPGADGAPGGGDDLLVATTVTSASGLYSFTVPPGNYFVEIIPPAGYRISLANQGADDALDSDPDALTGRTAVTTLIIGENDPTWDGGLYRPVAVGDRVWMDVDGDGVQDIGEPGISNVTVALYDPGADGVPGGGDDLFLGTAVTDLNGNYLFNGQAPDTYYVDVVDGSLPSGLALSGGSDPSDSSLLLSGDVVLDKDFGYVEDAGAVIGDFIWSDADNDGIQDPGEPGIGGVTVDLVSAGVDGVFGTVDDVVVDTQITDGDGSYYFTGVAPGEYVVDVTDTGGALVGYSLTSGPHASSDPTAPITVAEEDIFINADFGYFQAGLGVIGTTVWLDADNDGTRDAGEEGVADVSLSLAVDANGDGVWDADGADDTPGTADDELVIATTTTAANGEYLFTGLSLDDGGGDGDADYLVVVTDVAARLAGLTKTSGASPGTDDNSQVTPYAVALTAAAPADVSADFGYNAPGTIGDRVWSDADGDGVQDAGEAGIAGVTVDLIGAGADGIIGTPDDLILDTQATAADGSYLFTLLAPGAYRVVVTDIGGVLSGAAQTGDPNEVGTCVTCDGESTMTLSAGTSNLQQDFGYRNAALADISGTVFEDSDADGFEDAGEAGIPVVTLELLDAAGQVVATTTTGDGTTDVDGDGIIDPPGSYAFLDLPSGDYTVAVTDIDGVLTGYRLTSGLDAIAVALAAVDVSDIDFGYIRDSSLGSIGDFVWLDADRDGVQDLNEAGIGGVTLDLIDIGPDGLLGTADDGGVVDSTTTDAAGGYVFAGLAAGNYVVDVTDLGADGLLGTGDEILVGLTPTAGSGYTSTAIPLSAGEDYRDADFGFSSGTGSALGDQVWYDADGDGLQDVGEVGIGGVTVNLWDPGFDGFFGTADDVLLATQVTTADGSYLFTGLADGIYYVEVDTSTLPTDYSPIPTNGPATRNFDVPAAADLLTADYGFNGGTPGALSGTVYFDGDGNSDQGAGENGFEFVTVNLIDATTGEVVSTTTTDANGDYSFVGLVPGDYAVVVTDRQGIVSELNVTEVPVLPISVAAGASVTDVDFGYAPTTSASGAIGDLVFHDINGNGVFDPLGSDGIAGTADDESGFENVTLELWVDVDNDGVITPGIDNLVRTTVTDENGNYEFLGLPFESYLARVTDKNFVLDFDGDGQIHGDEWTQTAGLDPTPVTLNAANPTDYDVDFGYRASAPELLSGTVFFDFAGNGVLDVGDSGVTGAALSLYRDLDGDGVLDPEDPLFGMTVSSDGTIDVDGDGTVDPEGFYAFGDLPPGTYVIGADTTGTFVNNMQQTTQSSTNPNEPGVVTAGVCDDCTGNDFGFTVGTTRVLVSDFAAVIDGGGVRVYFETAAEEGAVGFYLYRWDRALDDYVQVNNELLPAAVGSPQGANYRIPDPGAATGETLTYALVEVEAGGAERIYGPYSVIAVAERSREARTLGPRAMKDSAVDRLRRAGRGQFATEVRSHSRGGSAKAPTKAPVKAKSALDRVKLTVREEGVYYIGADEISAVLGVAQNKIESLIHSRRLELTSGGEMVAWLAAERAAGLFFYAERLESPFATDNVYWLQSGRAAVMESVPGGSPFAGAVTAAADTLDIEEDLFPVTVLPYEPDSDFHYWSYVSAGHPDYGTARMTADVPDPAGFGGEALLTVRLQGLSSTPARLEHRARVTLNGIELGTSTWDGARAHHAAFDVPAGVLLAGANVVEVTGELDAGVPYSVFLVDGLALSYERLHLAVGDELRFTAGANHVVTVGRFSSADVMLLDVTDPRSPLLVSETSVSGAGEFSLAFEPVSSTSEYLAVTVDAVRMPLAIEAVPHSTLRSVAGAGYVVIAPSSLRSGAEALAAYRMADGMSTLVVDLEEVYDEFAHGRTTPEAVHAFLKVAYATWPDPVRFAVLVGAGTFDYKDVQKLGDNLFPPRLVSTPYGLFASDSGFADLSGDDGIPEIAIGRIPVVTNEELFGYVEKMGRFESLGIGVGPGRVVMLADNDDAAGAFTADSDALRPLIPEQIESDRVYLSEMSASSARESLFSAVAEGVGLINYLGHGGLDRFADEGLLLAADASNLSGSRLPVVTSMTCSVGRFEVPGWTSLGEALVLAPDAGAAAVFSPSGQSVHGEAVVINRAIFRAMFEAQEQTVGEAVLGAVQEVGDTLSLDFMLRIYNLLGDPAYRIR